MKMTLASNLTELLNPAVTRAGFVLEEVTVTPVGKRRLISVVVDCENRNPSLDEVTVVSKEVSSILDNYSQLGEMPFTLEVTTPGIDRPLTELRHGKKNVGRLVKITPHTGEKYVARIKDVQPREVVLESKGKDSTVAFADIARAQIEIEFNRKEVK
jgi:ribosome maturation factor RimP